MDNWELTASVEYRINAQDQLVDPSEDWTRFALENAAPHLVANQVLGRSLWEFISDTATQMLYKALLTKVRSGEARGSVELRCDAPHLRRYIRLAMSPLSNGRVQFIGTVLKVEQRKSIRLLDPLVGRSGELLTMCSWCKSVLLPDGRFVEVEEAVETLGLFQREVLPAVNHGICPTCLAEYGNIAM
jgi:hypothetical protein